MVFINLSYPMIAVKFFIFLSNVQWMVTVTGKESCGLPGLSQVPFLRAVAQHAVLVEPESRSRFPGERSRSLGRPKPAKGIQRL